MIKPDLLGRYECYAGNSSKYWVIMYNQEKFGYQTSSGAIGASPVFLNRLLTEEEAFKKIKEKLKKNYEKVFIKDIDIIHEQLYLEKTLVKVTEPKEQKKFKI